MSESAPQEVDSPEAEILRLYGEMSKLENSQLAEKRALAWQLHYLRQGKKVDEKDIAEAQQGIRDLALQILGINQQIELLAAKNSIEKPPKPFFGSMPYMPWPGDDNSNFDGGM
jgi:hypothetical protein